MQEKMQVKALKQALEVILETNQTQEQEVIQILQIQDVIKRN